MESVCSQDPPPHELYVFDDCSTDNSLDVIYSFASRYPFVRLLRYPRKSEDWIRAYFANIPVLSGDYILSLGADDYIYPGLIRVLGQMIAEYPRCGVFFADWHVVDGDRKIIGAMRSGVASACFLQGTELVKQLCKLDIFESGVASMVRRDVFLWLINHPDASGMGPWFDSMGYPVMAMKHGACYFPSCHAAATGFSAPDRLKYGHEVMRDPARRALHSQSVSRFLRSSEVAQLLTSEVLDVLEIKLMRGFDFPGREALVWRRVMGRARALVESRRFDEADPWLRRVAQLFPDQAEAFFALGVVQHKLGRLADEERCFRRAADLNPAMAAAHSNWGTCRQAQGFNADAAAAYRRAIQADPGFAGAHANLGNLLHAEGRWQEALEHRRRAVELSPQSAESHVCLAHTLFALGHLEEALAIARSAITLDPGLGEARSVLNEILRKLDRPEEAQLGVALKS